MGRRGNKRTETMIVANNDDDDSFGPTPPPPAYPHPDDLGAPAPAPVAVARDDERANTGGNGGAFADGDDEAGLVDVDAGEAGAAGPGGKKNRWKILGFANRRNPTEGGLDNQGGGDGAPNGEVQIQGLEEVLKDDPPAASARDDEEGFGRGRGGGRFGRGGGGGRGGGRADDTDNEVDEDMSVEIPPTTVVQRMEHKEENDYEKRVDNGKWTRMGAIAACILVVLAVILGVGYGTGAFQKSSSPSSSGGGSGGSSDPNRPAAVQSYVQSISTEGDAYFANDTDPGRLASNWLINSDPLQLSPDTPAGKFRLGQRYALLTFWYSSRANWANATGWASADDECAWYGVTCEVAELEGAGQVNVVTEIGMGSNGVQALSSDLFLLNNLKVLSLTDNVIVGPLPPALANASSLVEIDLGANGLQQDLSDFDWTGLVNLEILRLGGNPGFNGTLNDSLWTLVKLQELDLNGCRFSGEVGAAGTVDSLPSLAVFDVSNNRGRNQAGFSGSLPTIFASLPTLQVLGLGGNRFTGAIPTEYGSIPALSELNLADNQLTGGVTRLGTLANLTVLRLGGNAGLGGGNIPTALYDLTSLEALDISSIGYSGAIDPAIANLANLVEFNVSGNSLTGAPPAEMQALASLEVLHMQNNFFSGPLDFAPALGSLVDLNVATNLFTGISDLSVLSKLQYLSAQENQLGSPFPETVASISSLVYLDLSRTGLTGALPSSIGGMTGLQTLALTGNSLTGPIPEAISGMGGLVVLKLDGNQLASSLPSGITSLSNLEQLELQQNQLTGNLPADIGALYSLRTFRINNNNANANANANAGITGPLPATLSNMVFLQVLEVFSNRMTGTLPTEMGTMSRLRYLDLEFNQFTGPIPAEWAGMVSLEQFYLSSTQLTGSMPADICNITTLTALVPDCSIANCGCCSTCRN